MSSITLHSLDSAYASVEIKTAAGQALAIDGSGFITANVNGSVTIVDGGGSITVDGTVELGATTLAALENINAVVTATDLDIRDLTHVSDSVKIGDGTDFLAVNGDGSINAVVSGSVSSLPVAMDVWQVAVEAVSTTEAEMVATPLANRLSVIIENVGANDVFIGPATGVTAANGFKIPRGTSIEMALGASAELWAITATGASSLRIIELAD